MSTTDHSLLSSYREMLLEHLFSGEVMRHVWLSGIKRLEILKPQVDDDGYDLVLEAGPVVRHVQLKATFKGSKVRRFSVNVGLSAKPSGCVVCLIFDAKTLDLGPYYWLGGEPNKRLPDLGKFAIAKHTKDIPRVQRWAHRPGLKRLFSARVRRDKCSRDAAMPRACLEYGYTMEVVAREAGVNFSTVSEVIKGE